MGAHHRYPELGDLLEPFESSAQIIAAMLNPLYQTDTAYQKCVAMKMLEDTPGVTTREHTGAKSSTNPLVGRARAEFKAGAIETQQEILGLEQEKAALEGKKQDLIDRALEGARIQINPVPEGKQAKPFEYQADMVRAIADPRYERDEEYRSAVQARVVATEGLGVGVTIRNGSPAQRETAQ